MKLNKAFSIKKSEETKDFCWRDVPIITSTHDHASITENENLIRVIDTTRRKKKMKKYFAQKWNEIQIEENKRTKEKKTWGYIYGSIQREISYAIETNLRSTHSPFFSSLPPNSDTRLGSSESFRYCLSFMHKQHSHSATSIQHAHTWPAIMNSIRLFHTCAQISQKDIQTFQQQQKKNWQKKKLFY